MVIRQTVAAENPMCLLCIKTRGEGKQGHLVCLDRFTDELEAFQDKSIAYGLEDIQYYMDLCAHKIDVCFEVISGSNYGTLIIKLTMRNRNS